MAKLNQNVERAGNIEGMPKRLTTVGLKTDAQKAVATGIKSGELTEDGYQFQFIGVEKSHGVHGDFWFIRGIDMNEQATEILTSSKTLMTLINENYQALVNKIIVLSGSGQGFNRVYNIDIVGPGNMKIKTD